MRRPFFSGNYGSALGSTAQAANMIAAAGQAQGQMYAQLGAQIGSTIGTTLEKFRQKKKKKEEEERYENVFMGIYENNPNHPLFEGLGIQDIDEAKAVAKDYAKDPKLVEATLNFAKVAENKKVSDMQMRILQQLEAEAQRRRSEEIAMNRFLTEAGPSRIDPTGPDRNSVLRNLRAGQGVTPPARMVPGPSAAEQMMVSPQAKAFMRRSIEQGAPVRQSIQIAQQIDAANQPVPLEPTVGEDERDKAFVKDVQELNLADIQKGLNQLREASKALEESDKLTGPAIGLLPKTIKQMVLPDAVSVQEAVEEVVQRNLRLVLGAQFTEKEGERLISRAFNPNLQEKENKKRVDRLIKSIDDALQEKLRQRSYFEQNRTLRGYRSPVAPTIDSIENAAFGEEEQSGVTSISRGPDGVFRFN